MKEGVIDSGGKVGKLQKSCHQNWFLTINRGLKDKQRGKVAFKRSETASLKTKNHRSPWLAGGMAADQVTVRCHLWLEICWRGRFGLACCIENRLSLTAMGCQRGVFSKGNYDHLAMRPEMDHGLGLKEQHDADEGECQVPLQIK